MAVNKLRMNPDKSISELAKEIVAKWKKDVHQKNRPSSSSSGSHDSRRLSSGGGGGGAAATAKSPPKPSGKRPADLSSRNKNTDGVNWQCTGDTTRDNCLGITYDALAVDCDSRML